MPKINIRSNYGGGDSGGDPVRWFRGKVARLEKGSEAAMEQAMKDGAESMKHHIATRGTAKSGKAGRIEDHVMINAVEAGPVTSFGAGKIRGTFGWIDRREDYFGFQEGGFDHVNGGEVEGMYALRDAAELAFREFQNQMNRVVRDA